MLTHLHWAYPWVLWALPFAIVPLLGFAARHFDHVFTTATAGLEGGDDR